MQTVSRETLLNELESVTPGLSVKGASDQSNCFVFKEGKVLTFNDEIACIHTTDLEIEGAVLATPLLSLLRKLKEDEIQIYVQDNELRVKGKRRRAGIPFQTEIMLPIDEIGEPVEKWRELKPEFLEALRLVAESASDDHSQYVLTCVHIAPKYLEATDRYQASRFRIRTGFKHHTLIRKGPATHIADLGVTEVAEGSNWLHFRNGERLTMACRAGYTSEYPKLQKIFENQDGVKTAIPKGLIDATVCAQLFADTVDTPTVEVTLGGDKVTVKGAGMFGWYSETKKINYPGEQIQFIISPKLFTQLCEKYNECIISPKRIYIDGARFKYITSLRQKNAAVVEKEE